MMTQMMTRPAISPVVYVVDDSPSVQEGVQALLQSMGLRSQSYFSASEFLSAWHEGMSGCLLLDVCMPGMTGLELQQLLNARHNLLPIVFMTGHGDITVAVSAMQCGALDFIIKPFNDADLLERVDKALKHDAAQRAMLQERHEIRRRLRSLSEREQEILGMVVDGKANKVIAVDLSLSQRTVEIHRARVMEKMHANSLAQLVRLVIAAGEPGSDRGVTKLTRA